VAKIALSLLRRVPNLLRPILGSAADNVPAIIADHVEMVEDRDAIVEMPQLRATVRK